METRNLPEFTSNPLGCILRGETAEGGERKFKAETLDFTDKQYLTAGTDCSFAFDAGTGFQICESLLKGVDGSKFLVVVSGVVFIAAADFSINTWQTIAQLVEGHSPNAVHYFSAVEFLDTTVYTDASLVEFIGDVELPKASLRVLPSGEIQIYCKGSVISVATLATVNHLVFPINFSFFKLTESLP